MLGWRETMGKSKSGPVYQLKITLANVKPPVWRRVEVMDCSLSTLHLIIQIVMGWSNSHLWDFEVANERYGEDDSGELDMMDSNKIRLSRIAQSHVKKFHYTYDFGDNWDHVIQIEKILEPNSQAQYPRCVKGSRACPPDDCGGPGGYSAFVAAIQDPSHRSHKEMLDWVGGEFDPEAFDLESINDDLAPFW